MALEVTTLTPANKNSSSLRSTVPAFIVRQYGLAAKDQISWELEARGDQIVVVVRPIKAVSSVRPGRRKGQKGKVR